MTYAQPPWAVDPKNMIYQAIYVWACSKNPPRVQGVLQMGFEQARRCESATRSPPGLTLRAPDEFPGPVTESQGGL